MNSLALTLHALTLHAPTLIPQSEIRTPMNSELKLFTDPNVLSRVQRNVLTQFLEQYQACLTPEAAALLDATTGLDPIGFEEYCAGWAAQFKSAHRFGAPLLHALRAIEFLALPENASILDDALSHLPPGYEVNRSFSTLYQALYLWLIAQNTPGVSWPVRRGDGSSPSFTPHSDLAQSAVETAFPNAPSPDAPPPNRGGDGSSPCPPESAQSKIETQNSKIPEPDSFHNPQSEVHIQNGPADGPQPASADSFCTMHSSLCTSGDDAEANAVHLRRLNPWPDPVTDAPALFDQLHDRALHYLYLPPGAAVVLALWPAHAHAINAFSHSPRFNLTSSEPGCGKTTVLDFLAALCPNVLRTDNIKPAVLYRIVEKFQPTLILDEVDTYVNLYPELRGLLNAGHNQAGSVFRCEGPTVRAFKAFAATALAGLGSLVPTLRDRSIIIHLAKAPPGALPARFDRRHTKLETTLGRKIARWTQDNFPAIAACDPLMPPDAINRLGDNWRPLFAIAQTIGGHWPQRLVEAFQTLTAATTAPSTINYQISTAAPSTINHQLSTNSHPSTSSDPQLLLADVRQIFAEAHTDRLFSSYLVRALHALPNRPWAASHNGSKPITETRLARLLARLGVYPRYVRIGACTARGYLLSSLHPPSSPSSDTSAPSFEI